jgi:structure-specific recognition protein 1
LYPLEKSFVFIHKPPVLIRFDEVDSVEFQRYAGGQGSTRNFDLSVKLKKIAGEANAKEYAFSGIDRSDFDSLYNFLSGKKIGIINTQDALNENPIAAAYTLATEGNMADDSSEDEDFGSDDGENSSDDDMSDADESDVDMVPEDDDSDLEEARKRAKKEQTAEDGDGPPRKKKKKAAEDDSPKKKKKAVAKEDVPRKKKKAAEDAPKKRKKAAAEEESPKKKKKQKQVEKEVEKSPKKTKKKAKKDPNAPKRPRTAYTYFMLDVRAKLATENPTFGFGEIGRLVGQKYKELTTEEKEVYDNQASEDKERYEKEMENYTPPDADSDDDEDDDVSSKASGKKSAGKKPAKEKAKKDPNAP